MAASIATDLIAVGTPYDPQGDDLARILVAGVGGAGGNAVNHMVAAGLRGIDLVGFNTDAQALGRVRADRCVRLGQRATRGLGTGGDPAVGAHAAEESADEIAAAVRGADLVFVTLGLGGGTGTGAGPIVARIARQMGALAIGVATLPFTFEGHRRMATALEGLQALREQTDALIVIPNDRLFTAANPNITLRDAFRAADDVLRQGIAGLSSIVTVPGLINLDFADLRAVLANAGTALIAIGEADGPDRARLAARLALENPLLGMRAEGARGIIFSVAGGETLTLAEVQAVAEQIGDAAHPDAMILFGATMDDTLGDALRVIVVATGIPVAASASVASPTVRTPTVPLAGRQTISASLWQPGSNAALPEQPATNPAPAVRQVSRPRLLGFGQRPQPEQARPAAEPSYLRRLSRR
jgi:cell division protein FtsZ